MIEIIKLILAIRYFRLVSASVALLFLMNLGLLENYISLNDLLRENRVYYFKDNKVKKNRDFSNKKNWGFENLTKKPLIASKLEVLENNRARSAKLRVGRFIN